MSQFEIRLRHRTVTELMLVDDLQRVATELASPTLTIPQYEERGHFAWRTVISKFGTWNEGLKAASLSVENRRHIPDDELFENLALVWMTLGRQPFNREMSDEHIGARFSTGTYIKRFGSWNNALLAFSEYVQSGNDGSESPVPCDTDAKSSKTVRRRTPREINWRLRAKVLIKHSCICQMCGDSPAKTPNTKLHVDHILAWANGGETVEENLQTLCALCNIGKSDVLLPGQNVIR
jgi:HNH endonuclease/Homing endonuclease associated repeat